MGELPGQLPWPASAPAPPQRIRPVLGQPAGGLTRRQPGRRAGQVAQEEVGALLGIDVVGRVRWRGPAHPTGQPGGRTTRTGAGAWCTSARDTLPTSADSKAEFPREPTTTAAARWL